MRLWEPTTQSHVSCCGAGCASLQTSLHLNFAIDVIGCAIALYTVRSIHLLRVACYVSLVDHVVACAPCTDCSHFETQVKIADLESRPTLFSHLCTATAFDFTHAQAGLMFSAFGAVGVGALLSMRWLCEKFNDVQLIVGGLCFMLLSTACLLVDDESNLGYPTFVFSVGMQVCTVTNDVLLYAIQRCWTFCQQWLQINVAKCDPALKTGLVVALACYVKGCDHAHI
jgi:hypothetical protein